MKKLLAPALTAGLLLLPLAAGAADAMDKMDKMDKPAMMTTMMCRPAMEKEKSTAMMGKTPVVCKTITPAMMKKMEAGPNVSSSLTSMQVNDAWKKFVMEAIEIPSTQGGG